MLSPARPPRAGAWGKKRGQWGRRGRAASPSCPTLPLCPICELSGTRLASPSGCFSRGVGNPPAGCVLAGGAVLGEPHAVKGSRSAGKLREGVSEKRGWPFGCHKGVQTACNEPRHLPGTDISSFFFFLKARTCSQVCGQPGRCQPRWKTPEEKGTSNQPPSRQPSRAEKTKIFASRVPALPCGSRCAAAHPCSARRATSRCFAWARGPAVSVGFLLPPPPRSGGVGCSPEWEEEAGCSGRLARPGRSCAGCRSMPKSKREFN